MFSRPKAPCLHKVEIGLSTNYCTILGSWFIMSEEVGAIVLFPVVPWSKNIDTPHSYIHQIAFRIKTWPQTYSGELAWYKLYVCFEWVGWVVSPTNPNHRKHTERLCQASSEPLSMGVEIAYLHRCAKSHSVVSGIQCVNFLKQGNKVNTGVSKSFQILWIEEPYPV